MWTCGGCAVEWSGLAVAHCGACHRTFASVRLFDIHRSPVGKHGSCRNPERVTDRDGKRVLFWRDGLWRGRPMTEGEKTNARARQNAGTDSAGDA